MIGGGFGGSAGSAAADAVHRGIGPLPAGQRVAVITVREALTGWSEDFAGYGVPCEIGHYSVKGEQREYVDGAIQKRYLRASIPLNPDWDLNTGYENASHRTGEGSLPTHNLLRWVMLNKDKVVTPSSREAECPRTDFVCGRYTLATLLCTPFEEREAWRIAACRHRDIVYIRGIPMNEGVEPSLSESRDRHRHRMRYCGKKFQLIMTTAKTNFADVVRRGGTPLQASATAQAKPEAGPLPPPADAAKAALPPLYKGAPASQSAARKASPSREKPTNRTPAGSPRKSRASKLIQEAILCLSPYTILSDADEAGAAPKENEVVRESDAYNVVLRCQLGSHSIVLGAEVKAVDPSVQCEPGSTAGYVEFKTCGDNFKKAQRYKFYRHALLRWWAHCRLAGSPKAFCGFRNESGIVFSVKEFDVMRMPEKAAGKWSEDICMKFCDQLLSFIKRHVEENDGRNAYIFEYVPTSGEVVCKRLTDPGNLYGLPDWFLEAFEGY
ncbi:decapping and exoribonuclease protein-like [Dermacentor variabilis]|uniref:decapping and exoribonuclease protein-like n=1 Tax=Dermacentor variabilis TaxID=34621 RepID=UPI003F5C806D